MDAACSQLQAGLAAPAEGLRDLAPRLGAADPVAIFLYRRLREDISGPEIDWEDRVHREVAAKRAVLDALDRILRNHPGAPDDEGHPYYETYHTLRWVLSTMAAVYDDHPSYRPDWRPTS
jgi:hypothetical protein